MLIHDLVCLILWESVIGVGTGEQNTQCTIYEYRRAPFLNVTSIGTGSSRGRSECFEACEKDDNCTDIIIDSNSNSNEDIKCYINNGTGTMTMNFIHNVEALRKGTDLDENLDSSGCPALFSPLPYNGTRNGCYHIPPDFATNSLIFAAAEAACQELNCRGHLVQTETLEVTEILFDIVLNSEHNIHPDMSVTRDAVSF